MDTLLKYWINSIPLEGCALLESVDDLCDGHVFVELVSFVEDGADIPAAKAASSNEGRIRAVLCFLAEKYSWTSMPKILRQSDASEKISSGSEEHALTLARYLKAVFDYYVEEEELRQEAEELPQKKKVEPDRVKPKHGDTMSTAELMKPKSALGNAGEVKEQAASNQGSIPKDSFVKSTPAIKSNNITSNTRPNLASRSKFPLRAVSDPPVHMGQNRRSSEDAHVPPPRPSPSPSRGRKVGTAKSPLLERHRREQSTFATKDVSRSKSPFRYELAESELPIASKQLAEATSVPPLPAHLRADIILWLETLGVYSASVSYRSRNTMISQTTGERIRDAIPPLEDPWCNGVLLCEFAAVLCKTGDRSLVKELPSVCACGLSKPEHFDRHQELTDRTTQRGTPARQRRTKSGCSLLPGSAVFDTDCGIGWHRDRPRIILAGAVVNVRSMAQVLKNIELALGILRNPDNTGLSRTLLLPISSGHQKSGDTRQLKQEDILDCLPEDVIAGRVTIWQILHRVYVAYQASALRSRPRSRSHSPSALRKSESASTLPGYPKADNISIPQKLELSPSSNITRVPEKAGAKFPASSRSERVPETSKQSPAMTSISVAKSTPVPSPSSENKESNQDAGNKRSSASLLISSTSGAIHRNEALSRERKVLRQPSWDDTMTPSKNNKILSGISPSLRNKISDRLREGQPGSVAKPKSILKQGTGSPSLGATRAPARNNEVMNLLSANTIDPADKQNKRSASSRPKCEVLRLPSDALNSEIVGRDSFPPVTVPQQETIRQWLINLGLEVRDGDGGFLSRSFNTRTDDALPIPLYEDRLRDGLTLCDLALILEPNAARHMKLNRLVERAVRSYPQARTNVERALFLFRIRRCPPIPLKYLISPEPILKGNKNALWGLLWEIMQAYPAVTVGTALEDSSAVADALANVERNAVLLTAPSMKSTAEPQSPDSVVLHHDPNIFPQNAQKMSSLVKHKPLRYIGVSDEDTKDVSTVFANRRKKEREICDWIQDLRLDGHLQDVVGLYAINLQHEHSSDPNAISVGAIHQLENIIRNGTLLCSIASGVFKLPIKSWSKHPRSYNQCLSNVEKAIEALRRKKNLPENIFYGGMEDDIVRGEWSAMVGLLHELSCLEVVGKVRHTTKENIGLERRGLNKKGDIVPNRVSVSKSAVPTMQLDEHDIEDSQVSHDVIRPREQTATVDIFPAPYVDNNTAKNLKYRKGLEKVEENKYAEPAPSLDEMLGWREDDGLPSDTEVKSIMRESISMKLLRELSEATQELASSIDRSDSVGPKEQAVNNNSSDILPGNAQTLSPSNRRTTEKGEMILVRRMTPSRSSDENKRIKGSTSLGTPDWVRELKGRGMVERRPKNESYDEIESVNDSPQMEKVNTRAEAVLDAITGPDNKGPARGRSTVKRTTKRSNSAPPSKTAEGQETNMNYNAYPFRSSGCTDVLTSKRIKEAKMVISWLIDLNVDPEPLRDLLRLVRTKKELIVNENIKISERNSENSAGDVVFGYVNPIPYSFPTKDISSTLCELVSVLEWKFPHAPNSSSHAAPRTVPGTVAVPRHPAQRLQNIKRCFELLANNNKIPLSSLTCEEAVLAGRVDVILNLLMTIRKAYSITITHNR